MDHMCFAGIEPSSVILSQIKYSKIFKREASIMPKQVEANRDGGKSLQIPFQNFFLGIELKTDHTQIVALNPAILCQIKYWKKKNQKIEM